MLVSDIVHTAYRLHREGRLPARLGLSLDDLANVCPLPELESIISQGGGQGVNVFWSLQSLAQLRDHFRVDMAEAIFSATRCMVVFGGQRDEQSLERLSALIQEERVVVAGESDTNEGPKPSRHTVWRRLLSAAQLREIPDRWACLIYLNLPPRMLRQPRADKCSVFKGAMLAWSASRAVQPSGQPVAEPEPAMAEV
jgi:type IV secretion system protein VirD4